MPLYEFVCKCGHEFDELSKWDAKTAECPKCNADAKRKPGISSYTHFALKGKGWSGFMAGGNSK